MKVTLYSTTGSTSQTQLNEVVFGGEVNHVLLSQAVRVYLSNLRQGTSKVKTRSEVNRTKKKWFKQKHTGNARHGARTPNIFVGGGVSHGPNGEQNWTKSLSRDMKRKALMSAFSAQQSHVVVHEGITSVGPKAALGQALVQQVAGDNERVLLIVDAYTDNLNRAFRNIPAVLLTTAARVTALEVSQADKIVLTPEAVTGLVVRLTDSELIEETTPKKVARPVAATTSEKTEKVSNVKKTASKAKAVEKKVK